MNRRPMSPAQAAYADAKAKYDTVNAIRQRLRDELPELPAMQALVRERQDVRDPDVDAAIEALCAAEEQIEEELGFAGFRERLLVAENALIAWGRAHLEQLPGYAAQRALIEPLFECRRCSIREKLVALTFKLEP